MSPPSPAPTAVDLHTTPPLAGRRGWRWLGPGVWLVYLGPAAGQVVGGGWPVGERILGALALVAFVVLYLTTLHVAIGVRRERAAGGVDRSASGAGDRGVAVRTVVLAGLGVATSVAFGTQWLATLAFVAATLAIVLPRRIAPAAIVATLAVAEGLLLLRGGDVDSVGVLGIGFGVLIAGFFSLGFSRIATLVVELHASREENARLAVADERLRIARELHDLLGHSLSVIAVKSQLAERLLERDETERAAAELRDVRGVARDALHEVRHVVEGYRRRPLSAEVATAEAALVSAGIRVSTELPDRPVPRDAEDVTAFVVREGTTNVLRHAHAHACRISVRREDGEVVATVADDGANGPAATAPRTIAPDGEGRAPGDGHGLLGLAERLAPLRGVLRFGAGETGETVLEARVAVERGPVDGGSVGAMPAGGGRLTP